MKFRENLQKYTFSSWTGIVISTIFVIFIYFFMEWIFLVTKPSFMSSLNLLGQLSIFFQTASFVSVIYTALMIIYVLVGSKLPGLIKKAIVFAGLFIPGFLTACLILLLVDNFTYTVFQFGIVTSTGWVRALYGLLFLVLMVISVKELTLFASKMEYFLYKFEKKKIITFIFVFLAILVLVGIFPLVNNQYSTNLPVISTSIEKSPHIFLITVDGVNAENMSLYGYERETTPFLEQLAKESLVAENAFTNAANTSGSIISILTGKHPIDTRVLFPPDILKSEDAYQHLPAILKFNGYATNQLSVRHYVDAYQLNVINGFDEVNGRSNQSQLMMKANHFLPDDIGFFLYEVVKRAVDRVKHIYYLGKMNNPIIEVSDPNTYKDISKLETAIKFLDESTKPVFIHIHWMGTHGAKFYPKQQVFSADQDPKLQNDWELDFYDDSILEFDQSMKFFYGELEIRGLINDSIIIIASDHGQNKTTNKRLPLIIRFPGGEFQKRLTDNIQNLDIAPTIIDYLGLTKPIWMVGSSLLGDLPINRYIYAVGVTKMERGETDWVITESSVQPPFYQFGNVSTINCDTWYKLDLRSLTWNEQKISGYVGDCPDQMKDKGQVLEEIIHFFDIYNFDTTSIISLLE